MPKESDISKYKARIQYNRDIAKKATSTMLDYQGLAEFHREQAERLEKRVQELYLYRATNIGF